MMTCRCGGPLRLDVPHVVDARRFGFLATTPLLWRCCLCGRSRWIEESVLTRSTDAPDAREARRIA